MTQTESPAARGTCLTCAVVLSRHNRSGYCKRHVSAAIAQDPAWRAAQKAGAKRAIQADPARREALRARCRARNTTPEHRAWAGERARAIGLSAIGHLTANTPEAKAKRGASKTATAMAWCPAHLRAQYRALVYTKRIPAAEAREIILAQEDADIAAMRRRMEVVA